MFKKQEVICFFGDSITANGLWVAEVYQNIKKHCPVKCYNVGVAGASAKKAALYLEKRCLSLNPDTVVMMFGINDINYNLYSSERPAGENTEALKSAAIDTYKTEYEALVKRIIDFGARVIICIPSPYDEVNDKEEKNLRCQAALDKCGDFLKTLAARYACTIVDFKSVMYPMLAERDILSKDRIHPTPEGHHVMAQIFLKDMRLQDQADFDTPFIFEKWNKERYDAEQELTLVNFIEYGVLLNEGYVDNLSLEERKRIARERLDGFDDKTLFFPSAYTAYIEKIDLYESYMEAIKEKTVF